MLDIVLYLTRGRQKLGVFERRLGSSSPFQQRFTSLLRSQRGQPAHLQFKEPPLNDGEMEGERETDGDGG